MSLCEVAGQLLVHVSGVTSCCDAPECMMDDVEGRRTHPCVEVLASRPGLRPCVRLRRSASRKLGRGRLPLFVYCFACVMWYRIAAQCAPACRRDIVGAKTLQRSMSPKLYWYVAAWIWMDDFKPSSGMRIPFV
jgi:hypothetical protein